MEKTICYCKNVSQAEIEKAIQDGAKTLEDIQRMTGACTGNRCKELNPSGECCSKEINKMLKKEDSSSGSSCCCCG